MREIKIRDIKAVKQDIVIQLALRVWRSWSQLTWIFPTAFQATAGTRHFKDEGSCEDSKGTTSTKDKMVENIGHTA